MSEIRLADYILSNGNEYIKDFSVNESVDFYKNPKLSCVNIFERHFKKLFTSIFTKLNITTNNSYECVEILDDIKNFKKYINYEKILQLEESFEKGKITEEQKNKKTRRLSKRIEKHARNCLEAMKKFFCSYYDSFSDKGEFKPSVKNMIDMVKSLSDFGSYYETLLNSVNRTIGASKTNKIQAIKKERVMSIIEDFEITQEKAEKNKETVCKQIKKEYKIRFNEALDFVNDSLIDYVEERCYPCPWPPKK